jgi:glycerol 2-dehydrogenase (NADP+)
LSSRVLIVPTALLDKVKHIGVSNFNIDKLEKLAAEIKIKPATNQVGSISGEDPCLQPSPGRKPPLVSSLVLVVIQYLHFPNSLPQERLLKYCKEKGIAFTAFTPLGLGQRNSPFFTDPIFLDIAKKHDAEVAQVVISWAVLRGTVPIPKSTNEERIIKNITVSDY